MSNPGLALLVTLTATTTGAAHDELVRWRAEKDASMRAPTSPLSREAGRPLRSGSNVLGSGPADSLRFDRPGVPASCLDLVVDEGRVRLEPWVPVVEVDGQPAAAGPLRWGARIGVGPLTLTLQGGPRAPFLGVNDASLPAMIGFQGLHYLPIDDGYRVEATFTPADSGKTLSLETSTGGRRVLPLRGTLHFVLHGQALALDAFEMDDRPLDLFVIFKDRTNGQETYGSGRFVWVNGPVDGKTVVDFNFAWNPLCAYSEAFNCPLAPPENRLPVRIPVGEAVYPHGE